MRRNLAGGSPSVVFAEMAMAASTGSRPAPDKVRAHHERLREQGLRPIQIWVADVRSPAFKAEAHRQSLIVAQSPYQGEDQDFIDAVSSRRK